MVQRCIVLGFWLFFLVACGKEEKAKNYIFQAEVLGQNSDCGEFAVKFTTDIDKVSAVVGYPYSEICIAKNLPTELRKTGIKIKLEIRAITDSELGVCKTMGPAYPWIYVLNAAIE